MQTATKADREKVIRILTASFADNPSANDTIKQDAKKAERLRALVEYAVDSGYRRNGIYLSDDGNAAAIGYNPAAFKSSLRDKLDLLRLIHKAIGWGRLSYMLKKKEQMKQRRPAVPMFYLFFLGTVPAVQGKGSGSALLKDLMERARQQKLPFYLETSLPSNVQFYEKRGIGVYTKWDIPGKYPVHFMRAEF